MKKFFSKFENRSFIYSVIARMMASGIGAKFASFSIILALLVSIAILFGTGIFLLCLDYLLIERKIKGEIRW